MDIYRVYNDYIKSNTQRGHAAKEGYAMTKLQERVIAKLSKCGIKNRDTAEAAINQFWQAATEKGCKTVKEFTDAVFYSHLASL